MISKQRFTVKFNDLRGVSKSIRQKQYWMKRKVMDTLLLTGGARFSDLAKMTELDDNLSRVLRRLQSQGHVGEIEDAEYPIMHLDISNPFKSVIQEENEELNQDFGYRERIGIMLEKLVGSPKRNNSRSVLIKESKITEINERRIRIDFEEKEVTRRYKIYGKSRTTRKLLSKPKITKAEIKRLKHNYNPVPKKQYYVRNYPWGAPIFRPKIEHLTEKKREEYRIKLEKFS